MIGIYKITNIQNNKKYFGSSVNIGNRRRRHFNDLKTNCHRNHHLQSSYNKYGKDCFVFSIILELKKEDNIRKFEQYYLDRFYDNHEMCYNHSINSKYNNVWLGRKHTEETKKKLSLQRIGKRRQPHSEETKNKIRNSLNGHVVSQEARIKISTSLNKYHKKEI